jgi:glucuronoarabinoxylan endo-1,4-beta-xylanase
MNRSGVEKTPDSAGTITHCDLPQAFLVMARPYILLVIFVSSLSAPAFRFLGTQAQTGNTISIDASVEYQTIEGFGGAEGWLFPPQSVYPAIFDDLGVNIIRFRMLPYIEQVPGESNEARDNDNSDPFTTNWSNVKTDWIGKIAPLLQETKRHHGKLIATVSDPPVWMKTPEIEEKRGALKTGYENELVEFIIIWLQAAKTYYGIDVDYVSVQNEPDSGCCFMGYSQVQLKQIISLLAPRLAQSGVGTKILGPDTSYFSGFNSFVNELCKEPSVCGSIDRFATHPYGENFLDPDSVIPKWTAASQKASGLGKKLWMTEYCNDGVSPLGTWMEAPLLVQHLHNALVYGNVTAWITHEIYRDPGKTPVAIFDDNGNITPKYYTLKQYFHYVRPGAVRIRADSTSNDLLVTAFVHKQDKTFTIVVINRGASSQNVQFNINAVPGLSSVGASRTSASEKSVDLGFISVAGNSFSYAFPQDSITTFAGTFTDSISLADSIFFPQVAVGGGYSTTFALINTGATDFVGDLVLTEQDGNPLWVDFSDSAINPPPGSTGAANLMASAYPISIASGGMITVTASAVGVETSARVGWGKIESINNALGGVATFQLRNNGVLTALAGVLASRPTDVATLPVDDDGSNRSTGFAIANPNNEDINIKLCPVMEDGIVLTAIYPLELNPLNSHKQVARFVNQLGFFPSGSRFKGSLVFIAQGGKQFVAVALVQNERQYTAIPVIPAKSPNVRH